MTKSIQADPVPLREDQHGGLRVGESRVLLELVIHEFSEGATPEAIVEAYSTLKLADVYGVLSYYLNHRQIIEEYLERREHEAAEIRAKIESQQPDRGDLRERIASLRARRANGACDS